VALLFVFFPKKMNPEVRCGIKVMLKAAVRNGNPLDWTWLA